TSSSNIKGVSNSTYKQQGVNNIKDVQQGLNHLSNKQQGLSNSKDVQKGLNNSIDVQKGLSNNTNNNTNDKDYKVIRIGRSIISIKKKYLRGVNHTTNKQRGVNTSTSNYKRSISSTTNADYVRNLVDKTVVLIETEVMYWRNDKIGWEKIQDDIDISTHVLISHSSDYNRKSFETGNFVGERSKEGNKGSFLFTAPSHGYYMFSLNVKGLEEIYGDYNNKVDNNNNVGNVDNNNNV
ncbi:hypothetical protein CWI36_3076p0010, partial [Hamiltosporidium magnivora]